MSIITTIHQPNEELFNLFDNAYVLAKGGRNVYSGPPQTLRQHLTECDIQCNQNQIPIETLIRISFNGIHDQRVRLMCRRIESTVNIWDYESNEWLMSAKELRRRHRYFELWDFWNLSVRFAHRDYVCNWKALFKTVLVLASINIFLVNCFSDQISTTDGCFAPNATHSKSCLDVEKEKSILFQNQTLFFYSLIISAMLITIIMTINFIEDMKTFASERYNREYCP